MSIPDFRSSCKSGIVGRTAFIKCNSLLSLFQWEVKLKVTSFSSPRWRWFTKLPGNTRIIIQPPVTAKIPESQCEVIFPTSLFLNLCSLSPWWPQNTFQELPWQQMQLAPSSMYSMQRRVCVCFSVCTCVGRQGSHAVGQTAAADRRGERSTARHPAPSARITHHRWMIHNPPPSFYNHSHRNTVISTACSHDAILSSCISFIAEHVG